MKVTLDTPPDRSQVGGTASHTERRPVAVAPKRWSLILFPGVKLVLIYG